MKVLIARKQHNCSFDQCRGLILNGDICVKHSFKNSEGRWVFSFFHPDCYVQRSFRNLSAHISSEVSKLRSSLVGVKDERRKRGRPSHPKSKEIQNLRSSRWYHVKAGNDDKVTKIDKKLGKLTKKGD